MTDTKKMIKKVYLVLEHEVFGERYKIKGVFTSEKKAHELIEDLYKKRPSIDYSITGHDLDPKVKK